MRKRFITSLAYFIGFNVIVKSIYVFGIDLTVQKRLGQEIYGNYFYWFNLVLIFQILLDLGIENFNRKEIAHAPAMITRYLSTIVGVKLILGLLYFIACSITAFLLGISETEYKLLAVLMANQFMASFILYLRANLGGLQLFKTESLVSILDRLLMIILCGTLLTAPLMAGKFRIEWFVYSQTFAYAVTLLVSFIMVIRKVENFRLKFSLTPYIPIFKQLSPFALLVFLMSLYYREESIFLVKLLPDGEKQAGIYAYSFRILDYLSNYALLFPILLLPIFSGMIRKKENVAPLLKLAVQMLIIPSLIILIPCIFFREQIFDQWIGAPSVDSANIFAILVISFVGMCISYTFGALLTANGNLKELNIMAGIAVITGICLNLILVPRYNALGAAMANASTQIFTIVYHISVAKTKFKLKVDYISILKSIALLILLSGSFYILEYLNKPWYISFFLAIAIGLILAFALNLINLKAMFKIIRQDGGA